MRLLRRLFCRQQLRPRRRCVTARQLQPRQHHLGSQEAVGVLQLTRQMQALLRVLLGCGQVVPLIMKLRQPQMRARRRRQRWIARQFQGDPIGRRRLMQLIVRLLHVGNAKHGHQVHDEVTDGFGGGDGGGVGAARGGAIPLQFIGVAERPGRRRAHGQVLRAQEVQRALRLRDDRFGLMLAHGDGGADRGDASDQVARLGVGGVSGQQRFRRAQLGFDVAQLPGEEQRRRVGNPQIGVGVEFVHR